MILASLCCGTSEAKPGLERGITIERVKAGLEYAREHGTKSGRAPLNWFAGSSTKLMWKTVGGFKKLSTENS